MIETDYMRSREADAYLKQFGPFVPSSLPFLAKNDVGPKFRTSAKGERLYWKAELDRWAAEWTASAYRPSVLRWAYWAHE